MKISKKSWHYRLLRKYNIVETNWEKENLCKYFWKTFFAAILAPIGVALAGVIVTIPLYWWIFTDADAIILASLIAFLDIAILCGSWFSYRDHLRTIGKLPRKVYKHKKPSLFSEWLSAKHRKMCPYIEFVD